MIRFVAPQGSARTRSAGAGTSALSLANCAGWSSRYSHSYRHSNSNGYGNRYGVARVPLYLCSGSSVGRGRDSMVSTSSAAADKLARTYSARLSSNSPGEKLPHSNSYGYRNDTSLAASTATHPAPSDRQGRAVALPSKGAGGRVTIDIPSEAELQMLENELTSGKWASPAFIPLGGKTHMADTVSSKAVDRAAAISAGTATSSAATVVKPKAAVASKSQPKKAASSNSSSTKSIATVVTTVARAREVLRAMQTYPDAIWACDTEVAMLDVKKQGPVGNGKVVCVSLYGGDHIDFDRFAAHPSSSNVGTALFIDNMQEEGVLEVFKEWFEDSSVKKVWHNYGFDRHVLFNEGVDARGFAGDTMHMARLFDTSRDKGVAGGEGYSLASLSEDFFSNNLYSGGNKDKGGGSSASKVFDSRLVKTSMKELFGVAKLKKDGEESKVKVLPEILDIHTNTTGQRDLWIEYSAKDAIATWWIRDTLETKLLSMHWVVDGKILGNMYDFYKRYLVDFGELLTDLERVGIKVDTKNHLKEAERLARIERNRLEQVFLKWARQFCDNIEYLNIASTVQMQQLLFGTYEGGVLVESEKLFKVEKTEEDREKERQEALASNPYVFHTAPQLKELLKERGLKRSGNKGDLLQRLLDDIRRQELKQLVPEEITQIAQRLSIVMTEEDGQDSIVEQLVEKIIEAEKPPAPDSVDEAANKSEPATSTNAADFTKKHKEILIRSANLIPMDFTPTGAPQVSTSVLRKLAGKNPFGEDGEAKYGTAYDALGGGEAGREACQAIGALADVGQIDTTIANFLVPLQFLVDKNSRVHCSLNLNTETGRLSARRPNLQNQPALEKDQYKIRDAFIAEEGKTFIVADYGQLELRLLGHISNCKSMIDAFASGGCFHSRTAVGMYEYIKEAVDTGKVLLEWDYSKGQPTVPLVKDTYGGERRKAKTLNFSLAYGKTVHGLAQDWGITKEEAQETLDAWYRDRPEVMDWQEQTRQNAMRYKYVRTMMGRYRRLPEAGEKGPGGGHALRAAINTPIQGSAADVVMMAMLRLWKSEVLKRLGWQLLLQIHDEVILEGPKESVDEAMAEVRECMENPFDHYGLHPLRVHLDVDAKSADSWYKAK